MSEEKKFDVFKELKGAIVSFIPMLFMTTDMTMGIVSLIIAIPFVCEILIEYRKEILEFILRAKDKKNYKYEGDYDTPKSSAEVIVDCMKLCTLNSL